MDKELKGHMTKSLRRVAEKALADGRESVTVGVVYDGYTKDGTVMLVEVCEPNFDQSRYWTWKTFYRK